jgi:hypothetical protein
MHPRSGALEHGSSTCFWQELEARGEAAEVRTAATVPSDRTALGVHGPYPEGTDLMVMQLNTKKRIP